MKKTTTIYAAIFLLMLKTIISGSTIIALPNSLDNLLSYSALIMISISIAKQRFSIKALFAYLILGIISMWSSYITEYSFLSVTVLIILAIRKENLKRIISFMFKWEFIFLISHTLIALFFSLFGLTSLAGYYENGTRFRFNFGYSHPNALAIYIFNLELMWIWLNWNRINLRKTAIIGLISVLTFVATDSRTMIVSSVIIICLLLTRNNTKVKKTVSTVSKYIFPVTGFVILLITRLYSSQNQISVLFNRISNNRIRFSAYSLEKYGITVFGQKLPHTIIWDEVWKMTRVVFDCTYTSLFINNGSIWFVLISIGLYYLAKNEETRTHIFIIVLAIYSIMEVHTMNGLLFFVILLLSPLLNFTSKRI